MPNALTVLEALKIYGGQIHAVEVFMEVMPKNTPSGWDDRYEVKKPKPFWSSYLVIP